MYSVSWKGLFLISCSYVWIECVDMLGVGLCAVVHAL